MTNQHPITPPPELVQKWYDDARDKPTSMFKIEMLVVTRAAQWGADQELEACCEWFAQEGYTPNTPTRLRAARRPKPPSLKEQALFHFESFAATFETSGGDSDLIRRALEALPE